jgi:hypothetical protein
MSKLTTNTVLLPFVANNPFVNRVGGQDGQREF